MKTVRSLNVATGLRLLVGLGSVWAGMAPPALAVDTSILPDAEKANLLANQTVTALATSADGRLLVAMKAGSPTKVWIFDAYTSRSYEESYDEPDNPVSIDACNNPVGVFVGEGTSSYLVHVPCGDSDDGSIYQFSVTANEDDASALPFSVGDVSTHEGLASISATTLSADGSTLFLAGKDSIGSRVIYSLDATSTTASAASFAAFVSTTTTDIGVLAHEESTDDVIAIDSNGVVYIAFQGDTAIGASYVTCNTTPKSLAAVSASKAVLIGDDDDVRVITWSGTLAESCDAYDWGLTNPQAIARQQLSGTGTSIDALYIRASVASTDEIAVFDTDEAVGDPINATADLTFSTGSSVSSFDTLASSSLPRVYLGSSTGVSVLAAGPWFSLEVDSEPVSLVEGSTAFTVSLTSDEDSSSVWFDLETPLDSSVSGGEALDELVADTTTELEIDASKLDALKTGGNTIFLYALDSDGNLGWTALRVNYVETPDALTGLEVTFGNGKLYISFTKPDSESVDDYELLLHYEEFTAPDDDADVPSAWEDDPPSFVVDGTEYPGDDGWPMSLVYSSDSTSWSETDGVLSYTLYPLNNGVTYYLSIRATASGVPGPWTEVISGTPEETCGAACLAGDAGGFCSMVPVGSSRPSGRWTFPAAMWMVSIGWVLRRRRDAR